MTPPRAAMLAAIATVACLPDLPPLPELDADTSSSSSDTVTADTSTAESSTDSDSSSSAVGSTAASSTTTESTTDPDDADSTTFLPAPDVGIDLDECSVWEQDCPAAYKCMPWSSDGTTWNDTRCTPLADDPGQAGDACTVQGSGVSGIDDCDAASMCWDVDETNAGTCTPFCTGSEDAPTCEDPATVCSISNQGALSLCLQLCDPLVQDCVPGQACYALADVSAFACVPDTSDGGGQYPAECPFVNSCAAGSTCVEASLIPACSESCCTPYCDTSAVDSCPDLDPALQCTAWFPVDRAPPGYEHVGVCTLPQ